MGGIVHGLYSVRYAVEIYCVFKTMENADIL